MATLGTPDAESLGTEYKSVKPRHRNLYLVAFIALNGPTMIGFTLAFTSPAVPDMENRNVLTTDTQISWFSSLMAIGAIIGGPVAGYCLSHYGRKFTMMLCNLPLTFGYGLIASLDNVASLYVGRILTGIGTGMFSLSTPVYISELSSPNLRGFLVGGVQMFLGFGLVIVNALGITLSYVWLAVVGSALSTVILMLLLFMPETPHYCIGKNDRSRALSTLKWLRGDAYDVEREYKEIAEATKSNSEEFQYIEFLQPNIYIPLGISIMLMVFQQFSGIGPVTFYSVTIFQSASPSLDDNVAAIIIAAVQVVATFISMLLIERTGRKILLIVAAIGMCISTTTFGLYYKLTEVTTNSGTLNNLEMTAPPSVDGNVNMSTVSYELLYSTTATTSSPSTLDLTWLSLSSLVVFTSSFALAWGSIPWLIMSEILPTRARASASAVATMFNWLSAFTVTKEFFDMSAAMTDAGVFWFYGGMCFLSVIFVTFCVPETKGKSLEEISTTFDRGSKYKVCYDCTT
ncbi:solute carrier family 2, facilitated glucose transporter member 8-like [Antedon mediterranea]|uniref:solute carrier family 2, facilitated glucose transporter member 8-like n=1 Tax=Antedon mediterranea TaxID=105859 RepID=UPI003AF8C04C